MNLDIKLPAEFVSKAEVCDYKTPITEIIGKIRSRGSVVVMKDGEYFGVVNGKTIAEGGFAKLAKDSVGKFADRVAAAGTDITIENAISSLYNSEIDALPIRDGKKIIGIVRREKILESILSLHALSKVSVEDIMVSPIIDIDSNANVAAAIALMQQKKIKRLVVNDRGKPAGIITQNDILFSLSRPEERLPELKVDAHSLENISVGSVANMYLNTVSYDEKIDAAIKIFIEKKVSSVVAMRGGSAVGLITVRDVLKAAMPKPATIDSQIIISGLDDRTKEFENEMRSQIGNFISKADKFSSPRLKIVEINVKRKARVYEAAGTMEFERGNDIHAKVTAYNTEQLVSELMEKLYKIAKEEKEEKIHDKKEGGNEYEEE